jgi:putative endonuclease
MDLATGTDRCTWAEACVPSGSRSVLARAGERLAARHLVEAHGLEPVAQNLRVAVEGLRGELDVIVRDPLSGLLVVCEVKARTGASGGGALEALSARQQVRIRRMVAVLLADGRLNARSVRFDLIALDAHGEARRAGARATLRHLAGAW